MSHCNASLLQCIKHTREKQGENSMKTVTTFVAATAISATALLSASGAWAQTVLNIPSWGGSVDRAIEKAFEPWAKKNNVQIRLIPGTAASNSAKIIATAANPEFDLVSLEDVVFLSDVSKRDVLLKFTEKEVPNINDVPEHGRFKSMNGVPLGFYLNGLFYDVNEFKKNNWPVPTSWRDMFRPEYCKRVGLPGPATSYGINYLVFLSGFNFDKVPDAIKELASHKSCFPTLEPSSPKLEEKIQLGEYVIGIHGGIRALSLIDRGIPIKFITPKEGTALSATTLSVVKGSKNEKLSLDLLNWAISPEAQQIMMESGFYYPSNKKVKVPQKLIDIGMPDEATFNKARYIDSGVIGERRKLWARDVERLMAQ